MIFRVQLLICWRVIWLLQVYQVSIYPPRSRSQRQVRSAALHSLPLGQGLQGVLQRQRLKVAEGSILQSFSYLENRMPHLVGGFNPSENYESQLRLLFPWKNEIHVPNHHFPLSVGRTCSCPGARSILPNASLVKAVVLTLKTAAHRHSRCPRGNGK